MRWERLAGSWGSAGEEAPDASGTIGEADCMQPPIIPGPAIPPAHVALHRMRTWPQRLVPATALLLSCAPLFVLVLRGWTNAVLFLGALLALVLLLWRGTLPQAQLAPAERTWATVLMVAPVSYTHLT